MHMTDEEKDALARVAAFLQAQIEPLLKGHDPRVQGAVLSDLVAIWIAGHAPALREQMIQLHLATVRDLVPNAEERRRRMQ